MGRNKDCPLEEPPSSSPSEAPTTPAPTTAAPVAPQAVPTTPSPTTASPSLRPSSSPSTTPPVILYGEEYPVETTTSLYLSGSNYEDQTIAISELLKLTNLEVIDFSSCKMKGTLPTELGLLTGLIDLLLSGN